MITFHQHPRMLACKVEVDGREIGYVWQSVVDGRWRAQRVDRGRNKYLVFLSPLDATCYVLGDGHVAAPTARDFDRALDALRAELQPPARPLASVRTVLGYACATVLVLGVVAWIGLTVSYFAFIRPAQHRECSAMRCAVGQPMLLDERCVCVQLPEVP